MIPSMTKDEIVQLSNLARITLTDTEVTAFQSEIDAILKYVGTIQSLAQSDEYKAAVPAVHNVLRSDTVTHEPEQFTATLLASAPHTSGRFIAVKKILQKDE